ncbi:MAG TPA: VanZ family protein [Chitinophagaceae bacterium]|nr:VanZ family protein [Chitinophagaceae bacterium]
MKKNVSTIVFAIIWLLIITILLCIPGTALPKIKWDSKIWLDKWIHVFLFMVLVILWSKAYAGKKNIQNNTRKIFFQIMILGFFYGILMELVQKYFIPYRSFDLIDMIADAAGCVVGYFISIKRFVKNRIKNFEGEN